MTDATEQSAANLNNVLVIQLGAALGRVEHRGHGTQPGKAIHLIRELWDLGWDITPRLDEIGSKRERERRMTR